MENQLQESISMESRIFSLAGLSFLIFYFFLCSVYTFGGHAFEIHLTIDLKHSFTLFTCYQVNFIARCSSGLDDMDPNPLTFCPRSRVCFSNDIAIPVKVGGACTVRNK